MQLTRGSKVKWPSLYNEQHTFTGVVKRVVLDIDDRKVGHTLAIVDDGSGRNYRTVPTFRLTVINDPTKLTMRK